MLAAVLRKSNFIPSRYTPKLFSTHTSSSTSAYALAFLNSTFRTLPDRSDHTSRINLELKEIIINNHYHEAVANERSVSELISSIPEKWSVAQKITHLRTLRAKYYAMPILTGHPTEILSEPMRRLIDSIVAAMLSLNKQKRGTPEALAIEQQITADVTVVHKNSMLPVDNLTPEEEIARQDHIYLNMMESWPQFKLRDATQFVAFHGGDLNEIISLLESANKQSYQNVRSWGGDRDGNRRKSAKTIALLVPSLQTAIMKLFQKRIASMLNQLPELQSTYDYLGRCVTAIQDGIYFDEHSAARAQKRFLTFLDKLIVTQALDASISSQLVALRDLVDIIGFKGHMQQFVRQSSKMNGQIFQEFVQILSQHHPEIQALLANNTGKVRDYRELEWSEKTVIHKYIRKDSKYFVTLKSYAPGFSADTSSELEVLSLVSKRRDMFAYILSDTEHTISLDEVITLFGFSDYMAGNLPIDGIGNSPVNLLPLFESPKDLAQSSLTIDAILNDPYLKAVIIRLKELSYVAGPSDLGNEGGMFAHINLILAEIKAQQIFKKHQLQDPRLADVTLRVLNGLGDDFPRRISESWAQLYATFQGSAGCRLGSPFGHIAYVENVAGRPSENTCRALELELLEQNHPIEFSLLQNLIEHAILGYQEYNNNPCSKALFRALALNQLGAYLNTSSRGESKSSLPTDITKSRAIGLVNYEIMTFILARIFMSANALCSLPPEMHHHLPLLFSKSTTIREIVLKVIYSITVSDFPRAWSKIKPGETPSKKQIEQWALEFDNPSIIDKQLHHSLAYLERQSHRILRTMTLFFPLEHQAQISSWFAVNQPLSRPSHILGQEILDVVGDFKDLADEIRFDLLPAYRRLAVCLDEYQTNPTPTTAENAVLALRGDRRITAGPQAIAKLRVPLHMVLPINHEPEDTEMQKASPSPE